MLTRFRHLFAIVFVLLVASCSGAGCSGCGGCAGTTPLPGGFPKDSAIDNAASVRLSRPGLDFLEQNLPSVAAKVAGASGGKLAIAVPETPSGDNTLCVGGPDPSASPPRCVAEVDLATSSFRLDAMREHSLEVRAVLPLQLDNTPVRTKFASFDVDVNVGYGASGTCMDGKASVESFPLPVSITIPLVEETTAPRTGYTKLDVDNAVVNVDAVDADEVQLCSSCGFFDWVCDGALALAKGLIVDQLKAQLEAQVKDLLRSELCTKAVPTTPPCPNGSRPSGAGQGATCVYESAPDTCVPMLLGTDAHVELGGLLASISPGSQGGLDFGLAAAGSMNPAPGSPVDAQGRTPNGVSLALRGGVVPRPPSKCVPDSETELPLPAGIPVPDEMVPAEVDGVGAPHVGIALSGRFLQYSLGSVYRSGLLCLGVSTEQVDMLKSGLLSLFIPSLKSLTFEQGDAAVAIATRPQAPPSLVLGGGTDANADPLLTLSLPKFAMDFYIWSHDRYVRAFTFQADLTVPISLQAGKSAESPSGVVPTLGDVRVANGSVTNADLLTDDPALIAGALEGLIGGLSKQLLGGGISPIDASGALASFGLGLDVSEIRKLTKGSDDFIGVFGNLSKAATAGVEADTTARLLAKTVDTSRLQLATYQKRALPRLELEVGSSVDDGRRALEYTWWIDGGTRSPWAPTEGRRLVVQDEQLLLQGRHVLRIAARVAGQPSTEDRTPAELPFVIDALAPFVTVRKEGSAVEVSAWDLVTPTDGLLVRLRLDDDAMSEWRPAAEVARFDVGHAAALELEVKDEEGNVRSITQGLIRGRADDTLAPAASGCGCQTPGAADGGPRDALAGLGGLAGLAFVVLRRRGAVSPRVSPRTAALALGSVGVVAATSQGCACGSEADAAPGCGPDCAEECKPGLAVGMPGSYTSVAKAKDGTLWVAGYNDALLEDGDARLFGDLVVGRYDHEKARVEWTTADGVPRRETGCVEHDPASWRGGETDSGDDVGLWTSIQVTDGDKPVVSYYDATQRRLKVAVKDGDAWRSFVLKEAPGADIGRYAKMILDGDRPVIAYLHVEPRDDGKTRSKIVVARSKATTPTRAEDFAFQDVAVEEDGPCRADACPGGQQCIKSTGACTATVGGCTPACAAGQACVAGDGKATCAAVMGTIQAYPRVLGAYISLARAPEGLAIVAYDAVHGNLMGFAEEGGAFRRMILDGETGSRADQTAEDTGDVGIAASLFVDNASNWHVSYVNGLDETLRYLRVTEGAPGPSEVIDDGSSVDGEPLADGKHVVGDDSVIRVNGDVVVVYYQDATAGVLRRATGTPSGDAHAWDLRRVPQPNRFAGFFPQLVPGEDRVANWWRATDRGARSVTGDVAIVAP